MANIRRAGFLLALAIWLPSERVQGGDRRETEQVAWQTDVQEAWKLTQQQHRPLLVFVTRDHCFYCTQMKDRTYRDEAIAGAIRRSFVPLVIEGGGSSPLLKDLHVTAYPVTFLISSQAVIMDRIEGYVPPEVLANRLHSAAPKPNVSVLAQEP